MFALVGFFRIDTAVSYVVATLVCPEELDPKRFRIVSVRLCWVLLDDRKAEVFDAFRVHGAMHATSAFFERSSQVEMVVPPLLGSRGLSDVNVERVDVLDDVNRDRCGLFHTGTGISPRFSLEDGK